MKRSFVTTVLALPVLPLPLLLMLLAAGCAAEKRTYEVAVRNTTPEPVTIWLYKKGGPYEAGWKSPEDIAIESPKAGEPSGGALLLPGKLANAGPILGSFDSSAEAILRVYRGKHSFNELLAVGHDTGARTEVTLSPGAKNQFLVVERGDKLALDRVESIPTTQP